MEEIDLVVEIVLCVLYLVLCEVFVKDYRY